MPVCGPRNSSSASRSLESTPASMRKIIHIDADSFYASVEMRDDPSLRDKPIAVGGRSDRRGVIATSNYAAREFGVRSAMSSARALQLCPQLTIVKPRFDIYREVSREFHAIFREYTEIIEPLSLDEAFLDVSECTQHDGSATLIANEIRQRIRDNLQVTASAGVAPNKFLAKVASDWNKPDGTFTIAPEQIAEFVQQLPVSRIMGVGKVTARRLQKLGVTTCGDLQTIPVPTLAKHFGKYGPRLAELAHGHDERSVKTSRQRKSISVEHTYPDDISNEADIVAAVADLLDELARRFSKIENEYQPTKRYVKVKFDTFTQTTLEETISGDLGQWQSLPDYQRLVRSAWQREQKPVRLLGAGLRLQPSQSDSEQQYELFDE
jgi:DNA polymerase-4